MSVARFILVHMFERASGEGAAAVLGASVPTPEELVAGMRQQASVLGRAATSTLVAGDADPGTSLVELMSAARSEEHTSELQSRENLVCRLLLEKKKK